MKKLTKSSKVETVHAQLRRALKVQQRFVRNLARSCPDLLPDFQQVVQAHNAVIQAVVVELKRR